VLVEEALDIARELYLGIVLDRAVGLPDAVKGTALVLVAVPAPGHEPSPALAGEIGAHLAEHLGPAMRPSRVLFVAALPVTRSGKILRGLIRKVLSGEDPGSLASVANPEAVAALAAQRPL
jgi:acetyl-CoA synthetase